MWGCWPDQTPVSWDFMIAVNQIKLLQISRAEPLSSIFCPSLVCAVCKGKQWNSRSTFSISFLRRSYTLEMKIDNATYSRVSSAPLLPSIWARPGVTIKKYWKQWNVSTMTDQRREMFRAGFSWTAMVMTPYNTSFFNGATLNYSPLLCNFHEWGGYTVKCCCRQNRESFCSAFEAPAKTAEDFLTCRVENILIQPKAPKNVFFSFL